MIFSSNCHPDIYALDPQNQKTRKTNTRPRSFRLLVRFGYCCPLVHKKEFLRWFLCDVKQSGTSRSTTETLLLLLSQESQTRVYTYRRSISKLMCFISLIGGQTFALCGPSVSFALIFDWHVTVLVALVTLRRGQILDKCPANGTFLFKHNLNDYSLAVFFLYFCFSVGGSFALAHQEVELRTDDDYFS